MDLLFLFEKKAYKAVLGVGEDFPEPEKKVFYDNLKFSSMNLVRVY